MFCFGVFGNILDLFKAMRSLKILTDQKSEPLRGFVNTLTRNGKKEARPDIYHSAEESGAFEGDVAGADEEGFSGRFLVSTS
jgi:hypothetical protein